MSLTPESRARGCLLAMAAGNALGQEGVERPVNPASPHGADVALALIEAEELLQPEFDLQRLAHRWVDWSRRDGRGMGDWTRAALDHIAEFDGPPETIAGLPGNEGIAPTIPVALASAAQPDNLVSGSFHLGYLLHPDQRCGWSAVAVNATIACFLQGITDFIPEVLEVLKQNSAPEELIAAVRRVPLEKREALPLTGPAATLAVSAVEIGLWLARHEPRLERGLSWLASAGADADTNGAVAGALLGARDGEEAIPAAWISDIPDADRIRELANRLIGL
ncbi:MAG: ADP-ribosylglycohydrolase family protein [Gemmatimonadota bacterium]